MNGTTIARPIAWLSVVVFLAAACSGSNAGDVASATTDEDAAIEEPVAGVSEEAGQQSPSTTATEIAPTVSNPGEPAEDPAELAETNAFNLLQPGSYTSDLLPLQLDFSTTAEFNVTEAVPGSIVIESATATDGLFTGVGFFAVDTLLDSDVTARQRSRRPASVDLTDFLSTRDAVEVVATRDLVVGGLPAKAWRLAYAEPCQECWFELLFGRAGWVNLWGTAPEVTQELWTIDGPDSPIVISIEAPNDEFDEWSEFVDRHLFDDLVFGPVTGFSLHSPSGEYATGFGEYKIGRSEFQVIDDARPTLEVRNDIGLAVPAADNRQLLLSVAYPSDSGGFDSQPAAGSFPVIIAAPALNDSALVLPAERQLASHGFVVISVRFPESSFPGSSPKGVPQQPGDVSFVLDELERDALPAALREVADLERIGLVGNSGGATTAFGLHSYACCVDTRLDVIVAHAGTPYDFESTQVESTTPILHVISRADAVVEASAVREVHESTLGPSSIAEFEFESHLGWLRPESHSYGDAFELVLIFLDRELRDGLNDLGAIADRDTFIAFEER